MTVAVNLCYRNLLIIFPQYLTVLFTAFIIIMYVQVRVQLKEEEASMKVSLPMYPQSSRGRM